MHKLYIVTLIPADGEGGEYLYSIYAPDSKTAKEEAEFKNRGMIAVSADISSL